MIFLFSSILSTTIFFNEMIDYLKVATLNLNSKKLAHLMLRNNLEIKKTKLEIEELKLSELKNEGKFDWNLIVNSQYYSLHLPENDANLYTGNKSSQTVNSLSLQKKFKTETILTLEAKRIRQDSNALESARNANIIQNDNAFPVTFTDSFKIILSQEFLQSNFGKVEKKNIKIIQLNQKINEKKLFYKISQTLNSSLVNFWNLKLIQSNLKTANRKYKNTRSLYYISRKNRKLGLNKSYSPHLWNGEILTIKNEILSLQNQENEKIRLIKNDLNLNKKIKIIFEDDITLKKNISDFNKDYEYALENRADIYTIRQQKEILKNQIEIAYFKKRPSLSLKVEYSPIEKSNYSDFNKFIAKDVSQNLLFSKDTENKASINFSYRLNQKYDEVKHLKINYKKLQLEEKNTKIKIKNELLKLKDNLNHHQKSIQKQKRVKQETKKYYLGILKQFELGNTNSATIKRALDSFIDSEKILNQLKINHQILIFKYMLAKNSFFTKNEIVSP